MPNHVVTRLAIIGTKEQVKTIRKFMAGKRTAANAITGKKKSWNTPFDFNKIKPMAKSLQNIKCDGYVAYLDNEFMQSTTIKEFTDKIKSAKTKDIENLCKALLNLNKYGFTSWYDWSIENWGTKWNAYECKSIRPNLIEFQTAWAYPEPVIRSLSNQFPGVKFHVEYADEDIGSNCGIVSFISGSKTDETPFKQSTPEARKFARKLHNYDEESE